MSQDDWLSTAGVDLLRTWLTSTPCPMAVVAADSRVCWCNASTTELLGYSLWEFTNNTHPILWSETASRTHDLEAESAAMQACSDGAAHYTMTREFRAKSGSVSTVLVHGMRWPVSGSPVACYLVSLYPVSGGHLLVNLHQALDRVEKAINAPSSVDQWLERAARNPRVFTAGLILFLVLWLGPDVVGVLTALKDFLPG